MNGLVYNPILNGKPMKSGTRTRLVTLQLHGCHIQVS